ncbi:MAG TPA: tyrosinase family protein [Pyrinomonadaceae bacterium]|nr:tyrosinase family protein [Pyrinomonadaceae bacterium]
MKKSNFSRREFIKNIGIAGVFSLLGSSVDAQILYPKILLRRRCKEAGAIVRKNFKNLTAAELTAFKKGIAVMKSRPAKDPTSWTYQAAIHGTTATPVQTAWNTCQHNTTFFLSWHRMYLCFFERILRKAAGMPGLGLPYWNYSDAADPNARFLPAAFRTPADSSNSLYTPNRNASFNAGTGQLSASAVSLASALPGPTGFYPFSSTVNGTPHGAVHVSIGGWMGSVPTAAQDPIFWLHHCNIDRLWNRWLAGGGGRSNPPITDTAWHNTNFTFFDENGAQVQMKGADLVDAANTTCRSCYDEEAVFILWDIFTQRFKLRDILIGSYRRPLVLDAKRLKFDLELNDRARDAFARLLRVARPEDELTFRLDFEDVKIERPLDFYYEVYLNLPENVTDPDYTLENYAGNLSFFGANQDHSKHHTEKEAVKFSVNVTSAALMLQNLAARKTLSVTLVPTGLVSRDERRLPIRSNGRISVGQVTLSVQELDD